MTDKEIMNMSELDSVAGGNMVELERDLKFFAATGLLDSSQVASVVNTNNFSEVNKLVYETWQKVGVTMTGREGLTNSYTLPADGAAFGNNRRGALSYAKYTTGRGDIDVNAFI